MTRYVGIDLHKRLIVGHVVDTAGTTVDTFRYDRVDAFTLDYIGRNRLKPEDQVVLEATTHCWAVVRALEPFVARVAVSNPMATKAIATMAVANPNPVRNILLLPLARQADNVSDL